MAENKNAQQVREITDKLEQGIKELFESERFKEYLRTMSKFYNYSFNNTLLIAMQKPEATYVAGYTSWQRNFDRQVMKGEKGIKILAPAPYKAQEEREKVDPVTQKPVIGADGKTVTETVEVLRPAFKVVSVFDVSQTDGKELPDIIVDELKGTVENYEAFFDALKQESPVPISFEDIPGGAKGFFSPVESRIAIQEGMSEIQTVKTAIDQHEVGGHSFYLMEHDTYGDEAACIIVDERGKLVLDDVYNGFDDDTLRLLDLEVKEVPEMPDPALSVQDMKDYGYAWAGVLPAGQEAAEKALEKGCEVYRLYSDNTEGLCVDAKEIADHAAKGGMLGISKESWMAALEKENYLKAAEMSMEDDYGMIDGIINNGPKEDKTLDAKAPETREKSSIMDRLKAAKGVKQKECCPPKKHKGEIEL